MAPSYTCKWRRLGPLLESDNESVPSPIKPQPRVPYCKTYEEIRLEEIQAESAAYYSYQAEDPRSDAAGGKIKTRRTRRICLYPAVGKERNGDKELNFGVLTLEEIRRRKKRKAMEAESSTVLVEGGKSSTDDFLKDAMKTLAELRETTASLRGVKRTLDECYEDADRRKMKRSEAEETDSSAMVSVPPVKLRRRSPRRFRGEEAASGTPEHLDGVTESEARNGQDDADRVNGSEERNTVTRRSEVEIRLCDSSTDEDQTPVERSEERSGAESKEHVASCDSLLNVQEDDYLTLDMASDDILKDIDALLKEKSSV